MDMISAVSIPLPQVVREPNLVETRGRTDSRAIDKVSRDFEGLFLSILLKEMRQSLEPDTLFPNDRGDVLGGLFDMFLSQQLAGVRALGIADMVKKQLTMTVKKQLTMTESLSIRDGGKVGLPRGS